MNLVEFIKPGMAYETTYQVEEKHITAHIGGEESRVLSTPNMISFMERTSMGFLAQYLEPGYSSVGVVVNIRHLAPTPLGATVRVRCEVLEVDGWLVTFAVQAWDAIEQIGEGQHQRAVIEEARFLRRLSRVKEQLGLT